MYEGLFDCICVSSLLWNCRLWAVGCRARAAGGSAALLTATAITGLTGSEGRVLALQNRGHRGFRLAPSKQDSSAVTTGGQARCQGLGQGQTHSCTTPISEEEKASLREALGSGGTEVLCWVVLFSSSTGDSHCHCWPQ